MTNEEISARISALVDQQDDPRQRRELFDRMAVDAGARKVWQRYHLIGCVLRGEVEHTGADLGERIRAQLAHEPAATEEMSATRRYARWLIQALAGLVAPFMKPAGMMALAASIALAAVIVVNLTGQEGNPNRIAADTETRFQTEVREMLAQHGEFTSSPGLNGLVVYAKLVSNAPIEH